MAGGTRLGNALDRSVCIVSIVLSRQNNDIGAYDADDSAKEKLEPRSRIFGELQEPVGDNVESKDRRPQGHSVSLL